MSLLPPSTAHPPNPPPPPPGVMVTKGLAPEIILLTDMPLTLSLRGALPQRRLGTYVFTIPGLAEMQGGANNLALGQKTSNPAITRFSGGNGRTCY